MKRFFYLIILMSSLLLACNKDKDVFTPNPLFSDGLITTSFSGQVVDVMNQPVADALVTLGQVNRQTDENGFFHFKNAEVNSKRTMLNVSKANFFAGGRTIIPTQASNSTIKIQLLEKTIVANFDGGAGGQVDLLNGFLMTVPDDAVLNQNGIGYTDEVNVAAYALNPEVLEGLQKMPTDLKGENTAGETQLLESFGMFTFEWSDVNDEPLSIVPGKKIEVRFPVDNNILAFAPTSISLWFFDGTNWKEEGTATLENGKYVAEIGKSGFWNCARPHDFVSVKGVLKNENNQPLSNMPVSIIIEDGGVLGYNFVDAEGTLIANVPKELAAQIKVLDPCNDTEYNASIGALSEDALISNVKINNSSDFSHFGGTLLDCNNNKVQNGYVIMSVNTKTYFFPISNGIFKGDMNACNVQEATLVAYDVENQKQSEPLILNVATNVEAGDINVCF